MRIYGPNGAMPGAPQPAAKRPGPIAFTLPDAGAAQEIRAATAPRSAATIDALLAMQGIEDPTERRKRAVRGGRGALDALDALKLGLLSGNLDGGAVARLRTAAAELTTSSGDVGLDAVLSEIELRVEVELAKAGRH